MERLLRHLNRFVTSFADPVEISRLARSGLNKRAMQRWVKALKLELTVLVGIASAVLLWWIGSWSRRGWGVGLVLQEVFVNLRMRQLGYCVLGALGVSLPVAVAAFMRSRRARKKVPSPPSTGAAVRQTESPGRETMGGEDDRARAERVALNDLAGRELGCFRNARALDDIVMSETSRNTLRALAVDLRQRHEPERKGSDLPYVLLFWGPPGTGKRLSAMALATASGYAFWNVSGEQILADPTVWNRVLMEAGSRLPAIVFLDGAEAVLNETCSQEYLPLKQRVMKTLDGANGPVPRILFVCATHDPASLDPALLYGGTMARAIQFELPGRAALASYVRLQIRAMAADVFAVSRHTIEYASDVLVGCSFAEVDEVLCRMRDVAARRHFREGVATFTQADVRAARYALRC